MARYSVGSRFSFPRSINSTELSGPEAISFPEAAAVLARVSGAPVRFADEPDAQHAARLRADGTPEGYVQWRMAMLGGIRRGADAYTSDGVQQVLGRAPASFADWARREVPSASCAPTTTSS